MKPACAVVDYDAIYADIVCLPQTVVGEMVRGELHACPRPSRHTQVLIAVSGKLCRRHKSDSDGSNGRRFLENVLVTGVAPWRHNTLPQPPETNQSAVRPDWVCEVLSLSTRMTDRNRKLPIYAK